MHQDEYASDNNVLVSTEKTADDIPIDANNIQNIDPLIQPLIDTDELDINENIEEQDSNNLKEKTPSILTIHSHQPIEINSFSNLCRRCTGIFYALIGSSLFTCSGFIIKQLGVDFFDTLLFRFIIQTTILVIFIYYKQYKILQGSYKLIFLQIIRVILASGGLFFFYLSYQYIPLPDLTTFRYTQVIWTAILAMMVFHERISIPTVFAIILTLIGVTCVAQPTFLFNSNKQIILSDNNTTIIKPYNTNNVSRFLGLSLALACALSISGSIVLHKKLLVLKISQSVLMFQFSFLNLLILILNHIRNRFLLHMYDHQTMFTCKYLIAASVSLVQLISSTITQKAIKLEHPSIISVVQSSDILFAILLQNLFSNEKSNWLVIVGSALVTTSIFIVGIHKLWNDQRKLVNQTNNSKVETKI